MVIFGEGCRGAGLVFLPLPMETLGGWHEETVCQVKRLGSALARQTGGDGGVHEAPLPEVRCDSG